MLNPGYALLSISLLPFCSYASRFLPALTCNLLQVFCIHTCKVNKIVDSAESFRSITPTGRLCHEDPSDEKCQVMESIDQQKRSISPRDIIYDLLQECTRKKDLLAVRHVQSLMVKGGFDSISVLADHLIRLFTSCGSLPEADQAFCKVLKPRVYTWNSIIAAHAKLGRPEKALELYEDMQLDGVIPDKVTFLCVLKACGNIRAIDHGRLAHFQILMSDPDLLTGVGNMLVDMYSKCGRVEEGRKVFNDLPHRDVISWGALMTGYAQEGHNYVVLELFAQMHSHNVIANKVVFLSVLKACAAISAIKQGLLTHYLVLESEVIIDTAIVSALVDMYAKNGFLAEACQVFDGLRDKDVKAWGAIMYGYSAFGGCDLVEECFKDMKSQGMRPDNAIFTSILASYSHAGLLHQGHQHFQSMRSEYGMEPTNEHYNCMVDLLGRAGQLKEAKVLLDSAPNRPNLVGWLSLLTSCRTFSNPHVGRLCFTKVMELEPTEARGYMLMSNIYSDASMWDEVEKIQELRKRARAWRKPGRSSIEIDNKAFEFFVGGKDNTQTDHIYERLDVLHKFIKDEGYVPQLEMVLEPIIEYEKKHG